MADRRLPGINVIGDTPTSPEHGARNVYTPPHFPRQNSSNAPEVDVNEREREGLQVDENGAYPQPTTTDLEAQHADAGGLQVDPNGPYPQPTTNSKWRHDQESPDSEGKIAKDDAGLLPVDAEQEKEVVGSKRPRRERLCGLKRRTFIIVAAFVTIVVAAAAIGGGVGGYYASRSTKHKGPVTKGKTGMAALPCVADTTDPNGYSNPYLAPGATFNITCHKGVPSGGDAKGRPIINIAQFILYNFTSCMDKCAENQACEGVVYGANLTAMVGDGDPGSNCLLKNGTWDATAPKEGWFASGVKQ